jgi:hypothetical protein
MEGKKCHLKDDAPMDSSSMISLEADTERWKNLQRMGDCPF